MPGKPRIKVFLVDDHQLLRDGLRENLELEADFSVIGEAANFEEAVAKIPISEADVILMDIMLDKVSGLKAVSYLRKSGVTSKIIMLSAYPDYLGQAVEVGASGYLTKDVHRDELCAAIRRVIAGEFVLSSSVRTDVQTIEKIVSRFRTQSKPTAEAEPVSPGLLVGTSFVAFPPQGQALGVSLESQKARVALHALTGTETFDKVGFLRPEETHHGVEKVRPSNFIANDSPSSLVPNKLENHGQSSAAVTDSSVEANTGANERNDQPGLSLQLEDTAEHAESLHRGKSVEDVEKEYLHTVLSRVTPRAQQADQFHGGVDLHCHTPVVSGDILILQKWLHYLGNVEIVHTSGSLDRGVLIRISLRKEFPILLVLRTLPGVIEAVEVPTTPVHARDKLQDLLKHQHEDGSAADIHLRRIELRFASETSDVAQQLPLKW